MPISRRRFFAAVGAGLSAASRTDVFAADQATAPLRVIAYNVYGCTGWPRNRPLAKKAIENGQMARRLAMELALHEPDIVNFSESPSEAVAREVAGHLGMNHVRFPSGGNWPGTLLSRYEIIDSQNVPLGRERPEDLFTRHWGRAAVKLPNGNPLIVHSAHLYPGSAPETRLREIPAMLQSMKADLEADHSMLLIGDLNHGPDTKEYELWMDAGWVDTFAKVGQGKGLTIKADEPKYRIDYVMATGPIAEHIVESRPLFEGAFRLNVADPKDFALSDHLPQLAVFSESR